MAYTATRDDISVPHSKLTPRERDCLRLLSEGLLASEVRAELGISQPTLDAHLASARRQLDARTTLQAVLRFPRENAITQGLSSQPTSLLVSPLTDLTDGQIGLLNRLVECQTFIAAWTALQGYLANFDIASVNFGVISDPSGLIDESSVSYWCSGSEELASLYKAKQVAKSDPVVRHIASSTKPRLFDGEAAYILLKSEFGSVPMVIEYLLDYRVAGSVCLPGRDTLTGAAFGMNLPLSIRERNEFDRAAKAHTSELAQSLLIFWNVLQSKRLLANTPGLSPREQEVLQLVARGFAVAEIAERIHVSKRAAEQFLARARARLGARNNGQAIYRAMVYRALV